MNHAYKHGHDVVIETKMWWSTLMHEGVYLRREIKDSDRVFIIYRCRQCGEFFGDTVVFADHGVVTFSQMLASGVSPREESDNG